jgi:hypothetical protein
MSNALIAVPNGTDWINEVIDSEDPSTDAGWTNTGTIIGGSKNIAGVPADGVKALNTNSTLHSISVSGFAADAFDANNMYTFAFVSAGAVDWFALRATVTNAAFASVGGDQYFDLSGVGALGSFVAQGAGTLTAAGFEAVDGGFKVWAIIDCQGDDDRGAAVTFVSADSDSGKTYAASDTTSVQIYLRGMMFVDGPSGELPYIPT